ncbi:MAG: hypothetical protein AAB447_03300 [Patescibacteria group bacterium]
MENKHTQLNKNKSDCLAEKTYKRYNSQGLLVLTTTLSSAVSEDRALEYLATILVQAYIMKKKIS